MRYAVYFKQGDSPEEFLQSSDVIENVKKDKATLTRWLYEMGVTVTNPAASTFTVYEKGVPVLKRSFLGSGSRSWVKISQN